MKEIKAVEVYGTPYMTQYENVKIENRIYVTAISGIEVSESDWRGASLEEKDKWQEEMDDMSY